MSLQGWDEDARINPSNSLLSGGGDPDKQGNPKVGEKGQGNIVTSSCRAVGGWAGRRREARFARDFWSAARVSSRGNNERVKAGGISGTSSQLLPWAGTRWVALGPGQLSSCLLPKD